MPFKDWTTADVVKRLRTLGFGQYCQEFQVNEISGSHLPLLTEDHLREMGVASVGHRILMLKRFSDIASGKGAGGQPPAPERAAPSVEARMPAAKRPEAAAPERPGPAAAGRKPDARFELYGAAASSESDGDDGALEARRDAWVPPKRAEPLKAPAKRPEPANTLKRRDSPAKRADGAWGDPCAQGFAREKGRPDARQASDSSSQASGSDKSARRPAPAARADSRPGADAAAGRRAAEQAAADTRVTCEHCGRQLQPDAARRHIPVCARVTSGRAGKR
jgi:hypothetical protein